MSSPETQHSYQLVREGLALLASAELRIEEAWKLNDYHDENEILEEASGEIRDVGQKLSELVPHE
jgi:hypothetical protein